MNSSLCAAFPSTARAINDPGTFTGASGCCDGAAYVCQLPDELMPASSACSMEIDIRDVSPNLFAAAVKHLESIGATRLEVFTYGRQNEGPWLVAFVRAGGRRHVRATVDTWQGRSIDEQARDLASQLEHFEASGPVDHGV